jgi:hypothetical protein
MELVYTYTNTDLNKFIDTVHQQNFQKYHPHKAGHKTILIKIKSHNISKRKMFVA